MIHYLKEEEFNLEDPLTLCNRVVTYSVEITDVIPEVTCLTCIGILIRDNKAILVSKATMVPCLRDTKNA